MPLSVLVLAIASLAWTSVAAAAFGDGHGPAPAGGAALAGHDAAFWMGGCDLNDPSTSQGGIGSPPATFPHCIDPGSPGIPCTVFDCPPNGTGYDLTWAPGLEPSWRLDPSTQAAGRPDLTTLLWFRRSLIPNVGNGPQSDGDTKSVIVGVPPGLVGNPNAVPTCSSEDLNATPNTCPPETQVGVATVFLGVASPIHAQKTILPVYNVDARDGTPAELFLTARAPGFAEASIPIEARPRTDGDFGIDALALNLPGGISVLGQSVTLWGVPWAASHDKYRPVAGYRGNDNGTPEGDGGMPEEGLQGGTDTLNNGLVVSQEPQHYDPSWGPIRPFTANATECDSAVAPAAATRLDTWQRPGDFSVTDESFDASLDGCDEVPFDPDLTLDPQTTVADSPAGLSVDLTLPQNNDPPVQLQFNPDDDTGAPAYWRSQAGLATAQLDKAVVTLPEGVSINPSAAAGLEGCSDAQVGLVVDGSPARFNDEDPFDGQGAECPDGSRVGSASVYTPLLPGSPDEPNLKGELVLGTPKSTDPESGRMLRIFVVVRNRKRGLLAKIAGSGVADRDTGRLTATFDKNPRVPFQSLHLDWKGGPRGLLAMPQRCGSGYDWSSTFTPWTAAHGGGGAAVPGGGAFPVDSRCAFGFSPTLLAGMDNRQGGAHGTFSFRFARQDGEQWFASAAAKLPAGLAAKLAGVTRCTDGQIAAAACPASSRIGTVDAGGGSGTPFFLEQKGSAFLTTGYKGAPLGIAVIVPVEAGPFRGEFALNTIVVRQALHVNPRDASVTAISDPFPRIWHGIPLRVREATLRIDRPGFTVNPTDCSSKRIDATLFSTEGAAAALSRPFQATGCGRLGFRPKLRMRLIGRRLLRSNRNPGLRAVLTQPPGQANIEATEVRLPLNLALDPENAASDDLCEFAEGRKDDPHCPASSIIGRAKAVSPLLDKALSGNVYFVKNVRTDPVTGNQIRTLPSLLVALRGEISINVRANTSASRRGKLISKFPAVPDAPVSQFTIRLNGGKRGVLVVTRRHDGSAINLCAKRHRQVAEVDMDAHNGRRFDRDVKIGVPCAKAAKGSRRATSHRRGGER